MFHHSNEALKSPWQEKRARELLHLLLCVGENVTNLLPLTAHPLAGTDDTGTPTCKGVREMQGLPGHICAAFLSLLPYLLKLPFSAELKTLVFHKISRKGKGEERYTSYFIPLCLF